MPASHDDAMSHRSKFRRKEPKRKKPQPKKPPFNAFTIEHGGKVNRITTEIMVSKAFDPTKHLPISTKPYKTHTLWDTGSTNSSLTKVTIQALGLLPVGTTMVNHAGGSSQSNTYLVNFFLPNKVGVSGVLVTECQNVVGNFGAIIGMDIITQGDLAITNLDGFTWMSFRTPSMGHIDYVAEADRITFSGVGRNDPCPCGKKDDRGKPVKFKHCHGRTR